MKCTHPSTVIRCKTAVNGSKMYGFQCDACLRQPVPGLWVPHTDPRTRTAPPWLEEPAVDPRQANLFGVAS